jgi:CRP-like cAMP-binding protein
MKKKENEYEFKTLRSLRKGESLGLYSFFTGFSENMKIRTKEFCKMLSIKRSDFLNLLQEFPSDYEMFCYIKDLL